MSEWVVDTCVVARCDDLDSDLCNTAIAFLEKVYRNGVVCLDSEGLIQGEYLRNMNPRGHAMKWWRITLGTVGKLQRYSGRVPNRCREGNCPGGVQIG